MVQLRKNLCHSNSPIMQTQVKQTIRIPDDCVLNKMEIYFILSYSLIISVLLNVMEKLEAFQLSQPSKDGFFDMRECIPRWCLRTDLC